MRGFLRDTTIRVIPVPRLRATALEFHYDIDLGRYIEGRVFIGWDELDDAVCPEFMFRLEVERMLVGIEQEYNRFKAGMITNDA